MLMLRAGACLACGALNDFCSVCLWLRTPNTPRMCPEGPIGTSNKLHQMCSLLLHHRPVRAAGAAVLRHASGARGKSVFHSLRTGPRISETLSDCSAVCDQPHLAPANRVRRRPVRRLRRRSLRIPQVP